MSEEVCKYFGETGRNGFTRGGEHLSNKEADDESKSVLKLHAIHHHNGRADVNFSMKAYMQKTCDVAEMAILAKKIGGKSA